MKGNPVLVVVEGSEKGRAFPVRGRVLIGRSRAADIALRDPRISRRHASITEHEGTFYLRDEGSRNGTFRNGVRIEGEVALRNRDRIAVGRVVLEFAIVAPPARKRWEDEPVPERIGRFRIEERIGGGGMGVVYRATDGESGQRVALKCIRVEPGRRGEILGSLQNREATLAREVRHPTIVEIYDSGIEGDTPYIAMEYVEGESLIQRARRAALPIPEAVEVIREIAAGLAAAHAMGVVHGDVKPDNVLLLRDAGRGRDVEAQVLEAPDRACETHSEEIASPAPPAAGEVPFVGRELELAFLEHCAHAAREGRGGIVVVRGREGVGKRSLLRAFADRWEAGPIETVRADDAAAWGDGEACGETGEAGPLPLRGVFVLDGIDRADGARAMAGRLARLPRSPLLLLAALDDAIEVEVAAVRSLLAEGRRQGALREVYLKPFTRHQVFRYLLAALGEPRVARDLRDDMARASGGLPVHLGEALGRALDSGAIVRGPDGRLAYRRKGREILAAEGRRLLEVCSGYSGPSRRLLARCAFLGEAWTFDQARRFTGVDPTALYFVLGQAVGDGILAGARSTVYAFRNELLRRTLAERAARGADAARLHRAAAEALAGGGGAERAPALQFRGRHLRAIGEEEKALRALLEGLYRAAQAFDADRLRALGNEALGIAHAAAPSEKRSRRVRAVFEAFFGRRVNPYDVILRLVESGARPRLKITDFGISFRTSEEEAARQRNVGTPRYMSPEQIAGKPLDAKADVFALAVIAHEVISGRSPFPGARGKDVMRRNLKDPFPPLRSPHGSVPERLAALVEAMARKDPAARPNAGEVLRDLVRIQLDLWAHGA